jgi:ribose-phosphate pyrophosphokinase
MEASPLNLCHAKPFGLDGNPWVIIFMSDFRPMAEALCAAGVGSLCSCSLDTFADGTPNITLPANEVEGRDVLFIGSPEPSRYLEFFSIVYSVPRYFARSLMVVLPYFPTGTMERVEREGEVATAKTLIRMMSATPVGQAQTTFLMFDIHALATRFFFSDSVKVLLSSVIPDVAFRDLFTHDFVVCFPDAGAAKRFGQPFAECGYKRTASCSKVRGPGNKRSVVLQEGDVRGAAVLIVDDLVQSGSTLAACRDVLYAAGAAQVAAFVVHGVFPKDSWRTFLVDERGYELSSNDCNISRRRGFTHFFVTDTLPWVAKKLVGQQPYRVIPAAPSLTRILSRNRTQLVSSSKL